MPAWRSGVSATVAGGLRSAHPARTTTRRSARRPTNQGVHPPGFPIGSPGSDCEAVANPQGVWGTQHHPTLLLAPYRLRAGDEKPFMVAVSPPGHSRTTVRGGACKAARPSRAHGAAEKLPNLPHHLDSSKRQGVVELTNKFHAIREPSLGEPALRARCHSEIAKIVVSPGNHRGPASVSTIDAATMRLYGLVRLRRGRPPCLAPPDRGCPSALNGAANRSPCAHRG